MGTDLKDLRELRHLFQLLARQYDLLLKHCSCNMDINTVECTILYELKYSNQLTLNELTGKLNVDKSTASRNVQKLVERSLVQRLTDPDDRRYIQLSLTDKGFQLEEEITKTLMVYMEPAFKDMDNGRLSHLYEDLIRFIKL